MKDFEHGDASLMNAYARGELSDDEAAALAGHLAACDRCGEAFRRIVTGEALPRPTRMVEVGRAPPSEPIEARYQLASRLEQLDGQGRHLAWHRGLDWQVVLWRLGGDPDDALARARRAAQLTHPSLAQVLDFGVDGQGRAFVSLEPADGEPLERVIDRGARTLDEAVALVEQAVDLVRHLHARGRVHGRLEPARFVVDGEQRLRLVDPGLSPPRAPLTDERWAAPERNADAPPTPSEDVWFAAALLRALAGTNPEAASLIESTTAADPSERRRGIAAFGERLRGLGRDSPRGWDLDDSPLALAVFEPSGRLRRGNRAFRRRADREHGLARWFGELAVTRRNPSLKVAFAEAVASGRALRRVLSGEGRALFVMMPRAPEGRVEAVHVAWVDAA